MDPTSAAPGPGPSRSAGVRAAPRAFTPVLHAQAPQCWCNPSGRPEGGFRISRGALPSVSRRPRFRGNPFSGRGRPGGSLHLRRPLRGQTPLNLPFHGPCVNNFLAGGARPTTCAGLRYPLARGFFGPQAYGVSSSMRSRRMVSPSRTWRKTLTSPSTRPMGLTGLAARGSSPFEAGVLPKKMQNELPVGQ